MPYTPIPDIDYYEDESLHGGYQFVTLRLVTDYMARLMPDSYLSRVQRRHVVLAARAGMRELYFDTAQQIKSVELELSPTLSITVPQDFISLVRASWVDEFGLLHPMAVDMRMSKAVAYLQDNNFELLYDDDGNILQANGVRDTPANPEDVEKAKHRYRHCHRFTPNVNLANVFENGRYSYDRNNGKLEFGGEVNGRNIVLEYISDGMYTGDGGLDEDQLRIHKFAEQALRDYITKEFIKDLRNVPFYQIKESKKEYGNSKRVAKRRLNGLKKEDLLQAFRGQSRWIES